jgi:hypothetical protein
MVWSVGLAAFGMLIFAVASFVCLICASAVGNALHEWLWRQSGFDPQWIELGLTLAGSLGIAIFLIWMVEGRQARLFPGISILCGVAFSAFFLRTRGLWRSSSAPATLTFGIVVAIWVLVRGCRDFVSWVGQALFSIDIGYGRTVRVGVGLVCIVVPVLALRLWAHNRRRENADRSELMNNPSYRTLEEEKWQLENQLRNIDDKQLWIEKEQMSARSAKAR